MTQPVDFEKISREFEQLFKNSIGVDATKVPGAKAAEKDGSVQDIVEEYLRELGKVFRTESPGSEEDKQDNSTQDDIENRARDMAYKFWKAFVFGGPYRSPGAGSSEPQPQPPTTRGGVRIFLRLEDEGHRILFMQSGDDAPIALGVIDAIECNKKGGIKDGVERILNDIHVVRKISVPFGIVR